MLQLVSGFGSITSTQTGGVAYMAHIGGFLGGITLTFLLRLACINAQPSLLVLQGVTQKRPKRSVRHVIA
ncbi:MAG: hypothetical protein ACR2H4_20265 [Pyrinomonadaceae bacterium]